MGNPAPWPPRKHRNVQGNGPWRGNSGKMFSRRYQLSETRAGLPQGFRSTGNVVVTSYRCYRGMARFLGDFSASVEAVMQDSP